MRKLLFIASFAWLLASCTGNIEPTGTLDTLPPMEPDYSFVTVPRNLAPLNFSYTGEEECALQVDGHTIRGKKGLFSLKESLWKKLMAQDQVEMTVLVRREGEWKAYRPFTLYIREEIDPYLSYRLIPPGYQGWQRMGIYQRNLTSYKESAILTNDLTEGNCMNCHTTLGGNPSKSVFHVRAAHGGTMLIDGDSIEKLNTKTDSTISALVYPWWHPSGDYIAFSVNKILQAFYNHDPNRIEVYDMASDVVVYDVRNHQVAWSPLTKREDRFETFPTFSTDGKWLYFCSAEAMPDMPKGHREVRYGLYRIAFNAEDMSFGDQLECLYDAPAEGFSVSFPRVSPDGRFLCFTRHGYGNFSIWHHDADLWMLDLETLEKWPLEAANSPDTDSFHSWSTNGRWMVFSSRRGDGLYTRPYITYINEKGEASKPFLLPQKDPMAYYKRLMDSYNLPAFMTGPVEMPRHKMVKEILESAGVDVQAKE
ncbi:MAG: PD40 domain-containing protein [Bacteroidales bacterium]|nr:PD40 domain-containing protein [Bacteroidales bacterium]